MSDRISVAVFVFVAALLQVTLVASIDVFGGTADVLLLSLLAISLLRGAVTGAVAGFCGGLLIDVMTLDTLGVSALLYALAGYWTGRYGETTGRDRGHAPMLAVLVVTIAVASCGLGLHALLGEDVSARRALFDALLPGLALNLLLSGPIWALSRTMLRKPGATDRVAEVRLLG